MDARIWVFVPTYNEAGNLEALVRQAVAHLELAVPREYRLLVVDDNSPDGTGALAEELAAEFPTVEVLHRERKEGLGRAYQAGFGLALARGAELVLVMDADFSHDPAYLPQLIAASVHADVVIASRYCPGARILDWSPRRRLLSALGALYARGLLGTQVRDWTGGFKCVRREVLEAIDLAGLRSQGYVFNIELTHRALLSGFRVAEIPFDFRDRRAGVSKISLSVALEAVRLVPRLRRGGRTWSATATDPERTAASSG